MIALRGQRGEVSRPVPREARELLVERLRIPEVPRVRPVLCSGVAPPGGRQAVVPEVCEVGEAANRPDVVRQLLSYLPEHLTSVNVRFVSE